MARTALLEPVGAAGCLTPTAGVSGCNVSTGCEPCAESAAWSRKTSSAPAAAPFVAVVLFLTGPDASAAASAHLRRRIMPDGVR